MSTINSEKSRVGWVLYDFANSTYHLLIPTILMPLFFREFLAINSTTSDLQWAVLVSVSVVLAGLFGPFLGAMADARNARLKVLVVSAFSSIVFAAAVPLAQMGDVLVGGSFFALSYFFFTLSLGIYDSFLPLVVKRRSRGKISGLAWGLGYLGGIVALGLVYPILGDAQLPDGVDSYRNAIWVTCLIFAVFSLPSFILLRKMSLPKTSLDSNGLWKSSLQRIKNTLSQRSENSNLFKTIISYYLANDGLSTLVYFTSIYAASTLGFDSKQILLLFLIVQVVGIPASIFGGIAADRFGHKRVLYSALGFWIVLCSGFALCRGIGMFYALSAGTGLVIGTTPAVYRSLLSEFIPASKAAELYGFNSFASRASSIFGPLMFGAIATVTGSQRYAMISLLLFFTFAILILRTVNTKLEESPRTENA